MDRITFVASTSRDEHSSRHHSFFASRLIPRLDLREKSSVEERGVARAGVEAAGKDDLITAISRPPRDIVQPSWTSAKSERNKNPRRLEKVNNKKTRASVFCVRRSRFLLAHAPLQSTSFAQECSTACRSIEASSRDSFPSSFRSLFSRRQRRRRISHRNSSGRGVLGAEPFSLDR